jgi:hypothetical protein
MINLTNFGVTSPTAQETLATISNIFTRVFGISPDTTSGNSTNQFIQELTNMTISQQNQYVWLSGTIYNPNNAQGIFLEGICAFSNLSKNLGTKSTVTCQVTGLPNLTIPAGNVVINPNTNDKFTNLEPIFINNIGTGSGLFTALEFGKIPVDANSITQIQRNFPGWSTVNNSSAGSIGLLAQTDTQLRNIRKYALALNSTGWFDAMNSALTNFLNQDGTAIDPNTNFKYVLGYYIFENNTNQAITLPYDTITVLPHSVYITIYAPTFLSGTPSTNPTNFQYVAGMLLRTKSAGCQTQNLQTLPNQQVSVDYINKKWLNVLPVNIKWDSPTPTPLLFAISLVVTNPTVNVNNFKLQIQNAIIYQFYNGYNNHSPVLMVSQINSADYYPIIYDTVGQVSITSFTITKVTSGGTPEPIFGVLSPIYIPTLVLDNIVITVTIN